ncbi:heat shock protein Hsp18 [Desnuesiella massiliensis]|uniref:heat shock protein Hsp18 n=1 Tax=Desnuesiella massiliensis TaxID=1650662 RepID=UPI0006E292BE|nr:heat shock protein Hsp18 [Desnuesiella massiliensis]
MFDLIPFRKSNNLRRRDNFDDLFNDFFNENFLSPFNMMENSFGVDLKETDENYLIEADLPGVKKEDINVNFENNHLTISAKRDDSTEEKKENYVRRERHYGEFKRSFYVDNVDENSINASFNDGVLKLVLPKLNKNKDSKRKIDIN